MAQITALGLSAAALAVVAPATASGDILFAFRSLAEQQLRQAPLVPTTAPPLLRPLDETIATFDTPRGYTIRLLGRGRSGRIDRAVVINGGGFASRRGALRGFRNSEYRSHPTRVRGARGHRLTRQRTRILLWAEGGVVYYIATDTPRTVPFAELRATAAGLDRLEGAFVGSDEEGSNYTTVATTSRTATVELNFEAQCTEPQEGLPAGRSRGQVYVALLPRQGDRFAFDIGPNLDAEKSDLAWQGTVSGTVGANGGTIDFRATGTGQDGESCDTGPLSLALRPSPAS